jgi:hypothetical protein
MNNTDVVLVIMKEGQQVRRILSSVFESCGVDEGREVNVVEVNNPIDGAIKFNQYDPCLIIMESELNFLNAYSFSAILKGTIKGTECAVCLISEDFPLADSKVDFYVKKPIKASVLKNQLKQFFEKRYMKDYFYEPIRKAKMRQNRLLPPQVKNDHFQVNYLYSPFGELSGDCLDYWIGKNNDGLYGFLFDCVGHDVASSQQVFEVRNVLKTAFKMFQMAEHKDLGGVLKYTNEEMYEVHGEENIIPVEVFIFYLDFKKGILRYCSAGVPSFYVRKINNTEFEEIEMENYLVGYMPDADFNEQNISLEGLEQIIFSSDGFSDLIFEKPADMDSAKADDVSAVFISLTKTEERMHVK